MLYIPLKLLNDDKKIIALQTRTQEAGIHIPLPTLQYILRHAPRDNRIIFGLLESLIQNCILDHLKPSVQLAKKLLNQSKPDLPNDKKA